MFLWFGMPALWGVGSLALWLTFTLLDLRDETSDLPSRLVTALLWPVWLVVIGVTFAWAVADAARERRQASLDRAPRRSPATPPRRSATQGR